MGRELYDYEAFWIRGLRAAISTFELDDLWQAAFVVLRMRDGHFSGPRIPSRSNLI
jgi:hypothetical protein